MKVLSVHQYFKEVMGLSANYLMDDQAGFQVIYYKEGRLSTKTISIPRDCGSLESTCRWGRIEVNPIEAAHENETKTRCLPSR